MYVECIILSYFFSAAYCQLDEFRILTNFLKISFIQGKVDIITRQLKNSLSEKTSDKSDTFCTYTKLINIVTIIYNKKNIFYKYSLQLALATHARFF